jgi:hypothetical protein
MKEAAAFIGALSREQFALLQDGGAPSTWPAPR